MSDLKPHTLSFIIDDEGVTYGWKIEQCPGKDVGGCKVFQDRIGGCKCSPKCQACSENDHWACEDWDSDNIGEVGPGCSVDEVPGCGLIDWLDGVGAEIISGNTKVRFLAQATVDWQASDSPLLVIGGEEA